MRISAKHNLRNMKCKESPQDEFILVFTADTHLAEAHRCAIVE